MRLQLGLGHLYAAWEQSAWLLKNILGRNHHLHLGLHLLRHLRLGR